MIARYVHVEVRELRGTGLQAYAEADCVLTLPTGERAVLVAQLQSDRAPFWRVTSVDDFGNCLIAKAIETIGEEELFARIAVAASLYNVWDAIRAHDPDLS